MSETDLRVARRTLHAVAELVLAGPQFRRSGTIRLQARPGGFGTVAEPDFAIDGTDLVAGDLRVPIDGSTIEALAAAVGVEAGAPADLYHDGSGAKPGDVVRLDPTAAGQLARGFGWADAALRQFAPDATPVLWPEHFDIGITVNEVNYGVSPGDGYLDEPYAYVGPWKPRTGDFWNAPFGATVPLSGLADVAAVTAFFEQGRVRADADPAAPES